MLVIVNYTVEQFAICITAQLNKQTQVCQQKGTHIVVSRWSLA